MKYIISGLTSAHYFAYWAPSELLNEKVEQSFAICMTTISGVTYFPMDWVSACQDLSEKV